LKRASSLLAGTVLFIVPSICHAGSWQRLNVTPENFFDFSIGNQEICYIYYRGCDVPGESDDCDGGYVQCDNDADGTTILGHIVGDELIGPDTSPNWPYWGYPMAIANGVVSPATGRSEVFLAMTGGQIMKWNGSWTDIASWYNLGLRSTNLPLISSSGGAPNGLDSNGNPCTSAECIYGVKKMAYEFLNSSGVPVADCSPSKLSGAGPLFILGNNGYVYQQVCGARGSSFQDTSARDIIQISFSPGAVGLLVTTQSGDTFLWNDGPGTGWEYFTANVPSTITGFWGPQNLGWSGGVGSFGGIYQAISYSNGDPEFLVLGRSLQGQPNWLPDLDSANIDSAFATADGNPVSQIITMQEGAAFALSYNSRTNPSNYAGPALGGYPAGSDVFWVLAGDLRIYGYFSNLAP
jgi:hypothetical protein